MSTIQVTCPGCHTRFKVSDKFAGKQGPCPKCKKTITIPKKEEEVVIHAPETFGPKGASGQSVLKPIEREDTSISKPVMVLGIGALVLVPVIAVLARQVAFSAGQVPIWFLGLGAILLAPPLVWAGYSFLRDPELEPYRGTPLVTRVLVCSAVYAALWGLHVYVCYMVLGSGSHPELPHLVFLLPLLFVPGTIAAMATLDLDLVNAAVHYGTYLGATVLLRLIMGLSAL